MKRMPAMAVLASGLLIAGCSTELDGFGAKPTAIETPRVLSAPTGSVESAPMSPVATAPAPTTYGASAQTAGAAVTPATSARNVPLTPPPANPGGVAYAATNVQEQLAGAWTFQWDGGARTCPLTLATTRGASGLAAQADISCPSEIFMTKGWDVLGPDIVLQNHVGKVTARLQPNGPNSYVGVILDSNLPINIVR
ncbi:MAG: hypothetical protein B7Z15_12675 [Rhizobiales bacterium 32-66-8]|nr:MAG: hypothetical protein B7Z15_12675 [Rhizobiales bacterium 32-66-8]